MSKAAAPRPGTKGNAEDFPQGTRLVWPSPPTLRAGSYGLEVAPSATGQITMTINQGVMVRFDLPGGGTSEPREPVTGQPAEVAP